MLMEVPIVEIMPNTARCSYRDYSQDTFNNLTTEEQDQLYALARSIGGDDGPVQFPVIEKLKKPVDGKKYRCRDGDRRILATSVILGHESVTTIERSFTASYSLTALASQGQRKSLSSYDRLRNCFEAVEADGTERVIEESGLSQGTLNVYLSTWRGLATKTKGYCREHAQRLTVSLMQKAVGGDRRGDAKAQIAFLEERLFSKKKGNGKTQRKIFEAEKVGKALDRAEAKMLETATGNKERDLVVLTMQTVHHELKKLLPTPKGPDEPEPQEAAPSKVATRKRSAADKSPARKKAAAKRKSPARKKALAKKSPARKKAAAKKKSAAKNGPSDSGNGATLGDLKDLMNGGRVAAEG